MNRKEISNNISENKKIDPAHKSIINWNKFSLHYAFKRESRAIITSPNKQNITNKSLKIKTQFKLEKKI